MYSRLFKLPRLSGILFLGMCSVGLLDILVVSAFFPLLTEVLYSFSFLGVLLISYLLLFSSFLLSAGLSYRVFLHSISNVMNLRRTLGVSLFSLVFTTWVFSIGWALYAFFSLTFFEEFAILGLVAGFVIRLLVDSVMMPEHLVSCISDSLSQPLLGSVLLLWLLGFAWFLDFLIRLLIVAAIFGASTMLYVKAVGSQLKKSTGVDGRAFFSSFLSEWGAGRGEELEGIIAKGSVRKDLKIATVSFRNRRGKTKLVMIIPTIHPGPFKGVGSSDLPGYLMGNLEAKLGCPVICLHGPSTHGENLVRSSQCEDILKQVVYSLGECSTHDHASPLTRVSRAGVSVACQIFGDFALLTGSGSSSVPIDDISFETGEAAASAARVFVKQAFFVDSHSSIDPSSDYVWPGSKISETLVRASREAAQRASAIPGSPFKVGAAKIRSTGISMRDGMGKEGVSAIIMKITDRKIAYVFFDSNNLLSNIRSMIDERLMKSGFTEVEVLTSDTHSTSALSPGKIGYNPLGYSTPYDRIIDIVTSAIELAEKDLDDVRVCTGIHTLKDVRVAGEENMQNILKGTRDSLEAAKNLAPAAFGLATLISLITLLLL
jgi:putative membrane protein